MFKWCSFSYQGDQNDPLTQAAMFSCLCQILTEPSECQEKPRSIRPDVFRIFSFDGPFPVLSWQQWLHVHRCSSTSVAPGFRLLCVNYRDPEVNSLWSSHASPSGTNNHIQNHICTVWLPHDLHLCSWTDVPNTAVGERLYLVCFHSIKLRNSHLWTL